MKIQIAKALYLSQMSTMKKLLDLMAFKMDKRTNDYKYTKSQIMDYIYNGLTKIFQKLENENIIIKCPCGTTVRKGYKNCNCGGSGYTNKDNKELGS